MKSLFFFLLALFFTSTVFAQKMQLDTVQYPVYGKSLIKLLSFGPIQTVSIELWAYDRYNFEVLYTNMGLSTATKYASLANVVDKEYISLMTKNGLAVLKRHYQRDKYVKPNERPDSQIDW
jgi:hypothetical protein